MHPGYEEIKAPQNYVYRSMPERAADEACVLLDRAETYRFMMKPEKWARDLEYRALRKFEWAFCLSNIMTHRLYPRAPVFTNAANMTHDKPNG